MDNKRYLIAYTDGCTDIFYNLLREDVWLAFEEECEAGNSSHLPTLLLEAKQQVVPDDDQFCEFTDEPDPDAPFAFFTEAKDVFFFCREHNLQIVDGVG